MTLSKSFPLLAPFFICKNVAKGGGGEVSFKYPIPPLIHRDPGCAEFCLKPSTD